jgi:hypothetical protein
LQYPVAHYSDSAPLLDDEDAPVVEGLRQKDGTGKAGGDERLERQVGRKRGGNVDATTGARQRSDSQGDDTMEHDQSGQLPATIL